MGWVTVERLEPDSGEWPDVLALIRRSFAYMDGVIAPPSSAHRLTVEGLRQKAGKEICFVARDEGRLVGCVFTELKADHAYIGKLAVDPEHQRGGLGYLLVEAVEKQARKIGLAAMELQARVELTGNHAAFAKYGFREVGRTAHPGFDRATSITMRKVLE